MAPSTVLASNRERCTAWARASRSWNGSVSRAVAWSTVQSWRSSVTAGKRRGPAGGLRSSQRLERSPTMDVLYRTEATAWGGREGRAATSDGNVDVQLVMPKELGGPGEGGTNPEQLFATGYAGCFHSAL